MVDFEKAKNCTLDSVVRHFRFLLADGVKLDHVDFCRYMVGAEYALSAVYGLDFDSFCALDEWFNMKYALYFGGEESE